MSNKFTITCAECKHDKWVVKTDKKLLHWCGIGYKDIISEKCPKCGEPCLIIIDVTSLKGYTEGKGLIKEAK